MSERRASSGEAPELYDRVRDVLVRGGDVALAHFGRVERERKADGTEVTHADHAAEEALVAALREAFPGCGISSEEGVRVDEEPGIGTWFVDPIDGTSAFLDGLPTWGPTVCLVRDGKLVVGGLWLPRVQEFWYAERGRGAWRDRRLLTPEAHPAGEGPEGLPGRHDSLYLPSRFHRRMPIDWPGKVRAVGASSVHLAMVAAGGGIATIIPRWELWDVGCGILLVEEAGRIVTDYSGAPLDPVARTGRAFVAGTAAAVGWLTQRLASG